MKGEKRKKVERERGKKPMQRFKGMTCRNCCLDNPLKMVLLILEKSDFAK